MYLFFKRLIDILISLIFIISLLPLFLLIAFIIKINSPGPIFYKGKRAGLNSKTFKIIKFRSMIADAENKGGFSTALNDARLNNVGRFLRKYKLDELPQFLNVLIGDMSLVGPRPQVFFYINKYRGEQLKILKVKPGITDYASIFFSDMDKILGEKNVDEYYANKIEPIKNKLRIKYVKEMCFIVDIQILFVSFFKILGFRFNNFEKHLSESLNIDDKFTQRSF
jgi:lipopolysaccharide/colanic/teichoic acid biosynthesis glycosyltransferase